MAARKLQTEIDRTLKKVGEGVELFESIYEKMQASTNQTQKEKSELDLKTQIKKLQRLRDQIKTWVASNDIKDKSALLDNRKLIETQMEKFKACEKEMKTKAFSKEGLIQAAKLDPKEQEKEEAISWVNHQVEELQMQVEQAEAEVEALQGTGKKRNKGGQSNLGRQEELEHLNDRRKWHISRLEIVLRMLNNGTLALEKVNSLKEDVAYFVESNTDEGFDEDEGIYDELNLDEEEEKFGIIADDDDSEDSDDASEDVPPRPTKKHDEESVTSSKRDDSPILKKASVSLNLRTKPPPNLNLSQQPMATILKAGLQQQTPAPRPAAPAVLPPIRYAAAAAAAVAPPPPPSASSSSLAAASVPGTPAASTSHPPPPSSTAPSIPIGLTSLPVSQEQHSVAVSSPSLTQLSVTSPMLSSAASASQQPDGSFYSGQESPALSEAVSSSKLVPSSPQQNITSSKDSVSSPILSTQSPSVANAAVPEGSQQPPAQAQSNGSQSQQPPPTSGPSPLPQQLQQFTQRPKSPPPVSVQVHQQPMFPPGVKVPQAEQQPVGGSVPTATQQNIGAQRPSSAAQSVPLQQQRAPAAFPGSLSDLVVSFENVKQKALRANNLDQVHKMLEGGYANAPQPQDTEKPKYYVPRNPFQTAPYYPQAPHPLLQTPGIFTQLDVETLFWIFYYLPGTYQQYLAAKELKRQSWRFHVKYLTWFQRHSEPQAITEEYEQGVYVYFDWEGSWCQRKKSDFRFEYRYLSED
ncbi:General negative regulator of transcription subunit 3 [Psilocybe cubensis]|uniref:General negative regulator of transcription subunit 3 n=1 Tax=Psilocybe cubensis TaxID=181762 RepID=A0ACB8H434_PSICU|nr:General negative regulator of transcription subunit 3 [Psilocybe cubensis]KAH9482474.1 General negative regulator of transcription subunit 3 [Psilocybe cubensis]